MSTTGNDKATPAHTLAAINSGTETKEISVVVVPTSPSRSSSEISPPHTRVTKDPITEKQITVVVEAVSDDKSDLDTEAQNVSSHWQTGIWKQFPWTGIGGLFVVLICSIASILVLHTSDEKPASEWLRGQVAPNVLLTVFNSVSNLALALAVGQGIAINWWRRALNGETVNQLHYSWTFSTSLGDIFRKYKYFNMIALAVLMTKVAVIDGIMFQEATSTYLNMVPETKHNGTITAFGAQTFPITGKMGAFPNRNGEWSSSFAAQIAGWDDTRSDIDIDPIVQGCNGAECYYHMQAMGFAISCTNSSTKIDYGRQARDAVALNKTSTDAVTNLTLFSVNFSRSWPSAQKNYSALVLDITYPELTVAGAGAVCPADLIRRTCELRPAVLNYKLQYTNGSSKALVNQRPNPLWDSGKETAVLKPSNTAGLVARLNDQLSGVRLDYDCKLDPEDSYFYEIGCQEYDPDWRQVKGVQFVKYLNIVEPYKASTNSSLEGFYLAFQNALATQGRVSYISNNSWDLDITGLSGLQNLDGDIDPIGCDYKIADPSSQVMTSINTLTLMTAQNPQLFYEATAPGDVSDEPMPYYSRPIGGIDPANAVEQKIPATILYEDIFYASSQRWMFAAFAASLCVVLSIAPVFWGYWELGRQVTLGPFEIANAFHGPAFAGVKGGHVEEVLKEIGRQKVVYGHMVNENGGRLGFHIA